MHTQQGKVTVTELNTLLKGEYMASDSYEKVIQQVQDDNVKNELQKLQQTHKQHAIRLADRIQDLGGTPVKGVGIVGKAAETMMAVKDIAKNDTVDYLKDIHRGTDNGLKMAEGLTKSSMDPATQNLVNTIINEDRTNMSTVQGLINSISPQNQ